MLHHDIEVVKCSRAVLLGAIWRGQKKQNTATVTKSLYLMCFRTHVFLLDGIQGAQRLVQVTVSQQLTGLRVGS